MEQRDCERAAIDFYREKEASIGYCAKLAGTCEEDFIKLLGQNQISIFEFEDGTEFLNELGNTKKQVQ